jgi:hypothetical protein
MNSCKTKKNAQQFKVTKQEIRLFKTTCGSFEITRNQQNAHKLNHPIEDYLPIDIE